MDGIAREMYGELKTFEKCSSAVIQVYTLNRQIFNGIQIFHIL